MKKSKIPEKELRKVGGDIILSCSPGYDFFLEEFDKNLWRVNIFLNLDKFDLVKLKKIKIILEETYKEYNIIYSFPKERAIELWKGEIKNGKNILIKIHIVSMTSIKYIWESCGILKKRIISGGDFTSSFVKRNYNWKNYYDLIGWRNNFINFYYFSENIQERIRISMLKSSFLQFLSGVLYCKGKIGINKEKIVEFFKDKFCDKKMIRIIDNFYQNRYEDIDKATEDIIYFSNKLDKWRGFTLS